jgi:hypothetical protein
MDPLREAMVRGGSGLWTDFVRLQSRLDNLTGGVVASSGDLICQRLLPPERHLSRQIGAARQHR